MKHIFTPKKLIIIGLVITFVVFSVYQVKGKEKTSPPKGKTEQTAVVESTTIQETLDLSGNITANEQATLRFSTSGLLAWVGVKEGEWVKKGQALASLDRRALQKQLQKEMEDYLTERDSFEQTQDDYRETKEKHLLTDELKRILAASQHGLNKAVLDYELQKLTLDYSVLTTPISGIVTSVQQPFARVHITPATAEFTVVNPDSVYFMAKIDEDELGNLTLGTPATIILEAYPDNPLSSSLTYLSFAPISSGTTISYEAKFPLTIDNSALQFRLGMSGEANLMLREAQSVLVIPILALNESTEEPFVLVRKDSTLEKRQVSTGLITDTQVEITKGLSEGEIVVFYE